MAARLRPMTADELAAWLPTSVETYVAERVRIGESEEFARRRAVEQHAEYFPAGRPAPRHELFVVDDDGERVGLVWVGPWPRQQDDTTLAWLYDIEIDEAHRGRGLGRTAMELLEVHLSGSGVRELGLNVFGDNDVARQLYRSGGFREVSVVLAKELAAPQIPHRTGKSR